MYKLTAGYIKENEDNGQIILFDTFRELVNKLKYSKYSREANSSQEDNVFKMQTSYNSKLLLISIKDEVSLTKLKEKLNDTSYFIYNNMDNGRLVLDTSNKLRTVESFNVLIPISRDFNDKQELDNFYKSLSKYLEVRVTNIKSCVMPTIWVSTSQGYNANESVIDLNIEQYKNILDVDNMLKMFPIETKLVISNRPNTKLSFKGISIGGADISSNKQLKLIETIFDNFYKSTKLSLYNLACNLQELNLSKSSIQQLIKDNIFDEVIINKLDIILAEIEDREFTINAKILNSKKRVEIELSNISLGLSKNKYIKLHNEERITDTELGSKDLFFEDGVSLLKSPTNSGKTYYVVNHFKKLIKDDEFIILVVPTLVIYKELVQNVNVYGFYNKFDKKELIDKRIIVCVYDKLSKLIDYQFQSFNEDIPSFLMDKCCVFIDEAHNLYSSFSYRERALMEVKDLSVTNRIFKKTILMSGTFNDKLVDIDKIIEVKRTYKIDKECNIYYSSNATKSCINLVLENYREDNNRVQIIYEKNIGHLENLALAFNKENIKSIVLTSDKQDNDEFKSLYRDNKIDKDVKILLMTNIGEEGISILSDIYCTHSIDKINSTTTEQLSNRTRNSKPILNIHCVDSVLDKEFIDIPKKSLEYKYKELTRIANEKVKYGLINFETKEKEDFMKYCLWRDRDSEILLSDSIISHELYENDSKNELNFYEDYFVKKVEALYDFNVNIIKEKTFDNKLDIPNIKKVDMTLEIFDIYKQLNNPRLENFISNNKDKYDVNVLEVSYHNFKYLDNYFQSDTIEEYIKKMTNKTKGVQLLRDYVIRKENGNNSNQNWIFNNIKEDTTYSDKELKYLLTEYTYFRFGDKISKKDIITKSGFKKIIKTYFEVEEKRINKSKNVDKAYTRFSTKKEIYIKMKDKYTHNITLKTESLDDFFAN